MLLYFSLISRYTGQYKIKCSSSSISVWQEKQNRCSLGIGGLWYLPVYILLNLTLMMYCSNKSGRLRLSMVLNFNIKLRLFPLQYLHLYRNFMHFLRSAWRSQQTFLFLFCFFFLRSAWRSQQTFLFLFCFFFFFKGLPTTSEDLSVFVLFLIIFFIIILSYFSLPPRACRNFAVISQPISMKFGMLIVLDKTNRLNIFFKSIEAGVGIRRGPKFLLYFIIGKTLYTVRRDKNFT